MLYYDHIWSRFLNDVFQIRDVFNGTQNHVGPLCSGNKINKVTTAVNMKEIILVHLQ